jgi:spore germination cell wall hydrolase CwlJ-like protein
MFDLAKIKPVTDADIDAFARTIYGEGSNQGDAARIGIGSSILTRAIEGTWPGGHDIAAVCEARRQYDCWDVNTADEERTKNATLADPAFAACYGLALAMLRGGVPDNTKGAVFYHDTSRQTPPTAWGSVRLTVVYGRLKFYAKN